MISDTALHYILHGAKNQIFFLNPKKNHSVAIPIAATTFNLFSHLLPPPLQKGLKKKKKNPHPKVNFQN